jgi:hypothetical protein
MKYKGTFHAKRVPVEKKVQTKRNFLEKSSDKKELFRKKFRQKGTF